MTWKPSLLVMVLAALAMAPTAQSLVLSPADPGADQAQAQADDCAQPIPLAPFIRCNVVLLAQLADAVASQTQHTTCLLYQNVMGYVPPFCSCWDGLNPCLFALPEL